MSVQHKRFRTIAIAALAFPIGILAAYFAFLIVPEVVRVVVPAVVQQVVTQ